MRWYKNTIRIATLSFSPRNDFKADSAIVKTRMQTVMVPKIFVGASQILNSPLYPIQYRYNI